MNSREKRLPKVPDVQHPTYGTRFKLREKRAVFEALKRFQPNDIKNIQKHYVPWREPEEVDLFIKSMKYRSKYAKIPEVDVEEKAPIEHWLDKCEELTYYDDDYSFMLSTIMSIIGSLEPRESLSDTAAPDYKKIYKYLAEILQGHQAPKLPPFESAIVLDVITSISNRLKNLETGEQEQVMRYKYRLLSSLDKAGRKEDTWQIIRQALEQDPLAPTAPATVPLTTTSSVPKKRGRPTKALKTIAERQRLAQIRAKSKSSQPVVDPRPAKGPMFTLNPLCIPIKYLNIKEKPRDTTERDRIVKSMLDNLQLKITVVPTASTSSNSTTNAS